MPGVQPASACTQPAVARCVRLRGVRVYSVNRQVRRTLCVRAWTSVRVCATACVIMRGVRGEGCV